MEKIGVFYGTTSGKTEAIADEIDFNLKKSITKYLMWLTVLERLKIIKILSL